jgi:ABC-type multidrug transport system fused ATPase/permease subunit
MNNITTLKDHMNEFLAYFLYFIALGVGVLCLNSIVFMIWKYISRSISKKIRIEYLSHFIHQSVVNIEQFNGYEWANNFKMHTLNIEKSIGDKVALLMNLIGIVISGCVAALAIRWTLSL